MNSTLRQIAVSGGAAVALLGGAAAITTAAAPTASAAEARTVAHESVTAPVTLPDGRTMRITGMGGYGHHASGEHIDTVTTVAYRDDTNPGGTNGIDSGLTPDGSGSPLQNPYNQQPQYPAGYNQQQISTQAGGGVAIGAGVVAILLFGTIVFFRVRHKHLAVGDLVAVLFLGVAVGGTVIGTMIHQITNSGVGSLGGVIGGL
ncbi:hypothetical protein ACIHCX_03315 [Streptomyces sp. NPDC052043]|uniref:hypothetical protein n=1 Tax=Streptomyces sp. NPDC052043 TaxID=3365684 RepID=UPI0037D76284